MTTQIPELDLLGSTFGPAAISQIDGLMQQAHQAVKKACDELSLPAVGILSTMVYDHRAQGQGAISAIYVVLARDTRRAVAPICLAATSSELAPQMAEHAGTRYEVPTFAADALDDVLYQLLGNYAQVTLKAQDPAVSVGVDRALIVQAAPIFRWDDEAAVKRLVADVVIKLSNRLTQKVELDLSKLTRSQMLVSTVETGGHTLVASDGRPVRSDLSVRTTVNSTQSQPKNGSRNSGAVSRPLGEVHGYIDFFHVGRQPNPHGQLDASGRLVLQNPFQARMVITQVTPRINAGLAGVMLTLASMTAVATNGSWMGSLANRSGGQKFRDIGSLNIEGNLAQDTSGYGEKVITQSASFSNQELHQFLSAMLRPSLMFSIRLSRGSVDSLHLDVLTRAAQGDPRSIDLVRAACDELTGGAFSNHFKSGSIFVSNGREPEYTHQGYFTDSNGVLRDIAELDYLTLVGMAPTDKTLGRRYAETVRRDELPSSMRMAARKNLITEVCGAQITITDHDRVATFTNDLIWSLMKSLEETRVARQVNATNPFADYVGELQAPTWLNQAVYDSNAGNVWQNTRGPGNFQASLSAW
jgi:hypothetical protein